MTLTLIVEAVYPVDGGALVIASQEKEVLGILDLVCEQETYCLERLLASVDVITEKEVVAVWGKATVLEESEEVVVLTMNVT